jgi:penicillin-binding protein 2B
MKKKKELKNVRFSIIYALVALFIFGVIVYRVYFLTTSKVVDGVDLKAFASNRTTRREVLKSKRGTIFDVKGNALAQNVSSYTLIAYTRSSRTTNPDKPQHVVDIEKTATQLAPILGIEKDKIESIINNGFKKNLYQVEFRTKGRGLTELKKDEIKMLGLPGLDFIETQQRYYPYGNFLSYTIGYAKKENINKEDGTTEEEIVGEMGMEAYKNKELTGENGYTLYQKDRSGYKIPGTKEIVVNAIDGKDIYLTIDSTIQLFVEQAVSDMLTHTTADFIDIMMADANTGAILASYSYPSFDPNKRDMKSYLDMNISVPFEPGSTMKIYSFLAAMEEGKYNGDETYKSGIFVAKDGTQIGDWKREGWGYITHDKGFALSSNTAAMNLTSKYLSAEKLRSFYTKLGFGSKTGIELPNESSGKLGFKYETEIMNASFGQGITTTPIQNIKALTAISNNGVLLKPYIIDKIVDTDTNEVLYQGSKTELDKVLKEENVAKIKELMRSVITGTNQTSTGWYYNMEGYDFIGKTGTAQVASTNGTGYTDETIAGLAGMFPGDKPRVLFYMAIKNQSSGYKERKELVQSIVKNVSKYLEIYDESKINVVKLEEHELDNYTNKNIDSVKEKLNTFGVNTIVLGSGDKVINQYPKSKSKVNKIDKVFLVTNGEKKMPNIIGYSMKDVSILVNLLNLKCEVNGNGYVTSQSIPEGTVLTDDSILTLNFTTYVPPIVEEVVEVNPEVVNQ